MARSSSRNTTAQVNPGRSLGGIGAPVGGEEARERREERKERMRERREAEELARRNAIAEAENERQLKINRPTEKVWRKTTRIDGTVEYKNKNTGEVRTSLPDTPYERAMARRAASRVTPHNSPQDPMAPQRAMEERARTLRAGAQFQAGMDALRDFNAGGADAVEGRARGSITVNQGGMEMPWRMGERAYGGEIMQEPVKPEMPTPEPEAPFVFDGMEKPVPPTTGDERIDFRAPEWEEYFNKLDEYNAAKAPALREHENAERQKRERYIAALDDYKARLDEYAKNKQAYEAQRQEAERRGMSFAELRDSLAQIENAKNEARIQQQAQRQSVWAGIAAGIIAGQQNANGHIVFDSGLLGKFGRILGGNFNGQDDGMAIDRNGNLMVHYTDESGKPVARVIGAGQIRSGMQSVFGDMGTFVNQFKGRLSQDMQKVLLGDDAYWKMRSRELYGNESRIADVQKDFDARTTRDEEARRTAIADAEHAEDRRRKQEAEDYERLRMEADDARRDELHDAKMTALEDEAAERERDKPVRDMERKLRMEEIDAKLKLLEDGNAGASKDKRGSSRDVNSIKTALEILNSLDGNESPEAENVRERVYGAIGISRSPHVRAEEVPFYYEVRGQFGDKDKHKQYMQDVADAIHILSNPKKYPDDIGAAQRVIDEFKGRLIEDDAAVFDEWSEKYLGK